MSKKDPYGPRRRNTKPLPRASLPPPATSEPEPVWDKAAETKEKCCRCADCELCGGTGLVTRKVAQDYQVQKKERGDT